jgi:hypothetical protein
MSRNKSEQPPPEPVCGKLRIAHDKGVNADSAFHRTQPHLSHAAVSDALNSIQSQKYVTFRLAGKKLHQHASSGSASSQSAARIHSPPEVGVYPSSKVR